MDWRQVDGSRSRQPSESYAYFQRRRTARITAHQQVPPDAIEQLLRTPETFETWLRGQSAEAIVGDDVTPDDSPLANFIWDSLGVYVLTADSIFDGKRFHELPEWCDAFTRLEGEHQCQHDGNNELTAAEVLDILQRAVGQG